MIVGVDFSIRLIQQSTFFLLRNLIPESEFIETEIPYFSSICPWFRKQVFRSISTHENDPNFFNSPHSICGFVFH